MKIVAQTLMVIALLNFFSFMIVASILGGDAVNGRTDGQRYYLGSHGHYTEVSRSVFEYSKFHTHSVWFTHSLAFVGAAIYFWVRKRGSSHAA
jgi:hypothetical protein